MNHAAAHLEMAAEVAEHNAPISAAEGNQDQAELQREVAHDCRDAIELLQEQA